MVLGLWRQVWDSSVPVVEKVQQDPHFFWFLIGVRIPLVLQSMEGGCSLCVVSVCVFGCLGVPI